jgi:hypothetical protein
VDAFHAASLAAGGRDTGPPGPRPHYHQHYYGAFVLDPDGNNLEAVCHRPPELQQERPNVKMASVCAGHRLVGTPAGVEPATPS